MPKKQLRKDLRDRLEAGVTRAGEFFSGNRHEQTLRFGKFEQSFWTDLLDRGWPKYDQLVAEGSKVLPHFDQLLTDVFLGLYLTGPQMRDESEMKLSHKANHQLMSEALQSQIWEQARSRSMLNKTHAMIGMLYVAETILSTMPQEDQVSAQQQQEKLDQLQELIDNAQAAAAGDDETEAEAAAEALESALGEMDDGMDSDLARRLMKKSLGAAKQEMEEFEELAITWGTTPGELGTMPIDEAFELREKMRKLPNLRRFTDELGRMRQHAREASHQLYAHEPHEIVDVTTGGSWHSMLPNERMSLADPDLELMFWAKYVQEGNLSWMYAGESPAGQGPFIVLLDVSGSTMGTREIWGKAFALASLEMAHRQRRDVGVIMFDYEVKDEGIFVFEGGTASLAEKVELASYFTGGGTEFNEPLRIAVENIQERVGGWESADIVMVTDGECEVTPDFLVWFKARCQALGIRVQGVILDGYPEMAQGMEEFCDRVVQVRSFEMNGSEIYNRAVA